MNKLSYWFGKSMNLISFVIKGFKTDAPTKKRMYVIVRKELSETYRMVQGAHALAKYSLQFPDSFDWWNNGYLIFLSTFLPKSLEELNQKFFENGVRCADFREIDLSNQLTAICVFYNPSMPREARKIWKIVKNLPLA